MVWGTEQEMEVLLAQVLGQELDGVKALVLADELEQTLGYG